MKINVSNCDDCPFLWENMEYAESRCKAAKRSWGMGYHETGDPTPDWCPLRKSAISVKLKKRSAT